jgi:hypothetical protein
MTIEQAKQVLKEAGYYVENLWSIEDVKSQYKCTDEQAYDVLDDAFNNERIIEELFIGIDSSANYYDLILRTNNNK